MFMPQTSFASGNVNIRFRDVHPSMVDRIDLCSTSNGDPGASGTLSPFCELHSMHFSENPTYVSEIGEVEDLNIED